MTRKLLLRLSLLAVALVFTGLRPAVADVPTGFTDTMVATGLGTPTKVNFLPDGRMLITTQGGTLRVYCPSNGLPGCSSVGASGGLLPTPALTFTASQICTNSERGLLGVAVDPSFSTNGFIYLYYTLNKSGCGTGGGSSPPPSNIAVNRVSRFVFNSANNTAGTETVLVDNMLNPGGNHNAGDVDFGKDGYLYITVGDGGCDYAGDSGCQGQNDASRDENRLEGKVLRIAKDGTIPPTNPWAATGDRCNVNGFTVAGHRCQETFSWGHRNPFRFAFDPNAAGTRFFIDEVGEGAEEEINLGQAGADFGWNCKEGTLTNSTTGKCSPTPPNMVDPIFEYSHSGNIPGTTISGCNCITGGAFVPNGVWPAAYNGLYLAADYGCGGMFKMTTAAPYTAANFGTNFGGNSVISMRFGPFLGTQALYYTTAASTGQVRRIVNSTPVAVASSDIPGGPTPPVTVTFSGAGSFDPNGVALMYTWNFGDGSPPQTIAGVTIQHTYTVLGTYTATLRVSNGTLTSDPATVVILVGTPPPGTFFTVTPCRVVDTRGTAGVPLGGPALASGATRPFTLINNCGIPTGVKAVAVNITVVSPTQGGDLRLFPTGGTATSSNLNFSAGQTRANNAAVKVSASGQVSVTCSMAAAGSTDFLLDVVGYFE